jgi:hypothetical protein
MIFSKIAGISQMNEFVVIGGSLVPHLTGKESTDVIGLAAFGARDGKRILAGADQGRFAHFRQKLTAFDPSWQPDDTSYVAAIVDTDTLDALSHAIREKRIDIDALGFNGSKISDVICLLDADQHSKFDDLVERHLRADERLLVTAGMHAEQIVERLIEPSTTIMRGDEVKAVYDRIVADVFLADQGELDLDESVSAAAHHAEMGAAQPEPVD